MRRDINVISLVCPGHMLLYLMMSSTLLRHLHSAGILLDVDDVTETAALATGISLDEAEIYDELLSPSALIGEILPPANNDFYDEKKDKLIPKQLHAYKFFKDIQANKQHPLKKQMTLNYYKPFEKETISLDYETRLQVVNLISRL